MTLRVHHTQSLTDLPKQTQKSSYSLPHSGTVHAHYITCCLSQNQGPEDISSYSLLIGSAGRKGRVETGTLKAAVSDEVRHELESHACDCWESVPTD